MYIFIYIYIHTNVHNNFHTEPFTKHNHIIKHANVTRILRWLHNKDSFLQKIKMVSAGQAALWRRGGILHFDLLDKRMSTDWGCELRLSADWGCEPQMLRWLHNRAWF